MKRRVSARPIVVETKNRRPPNLSAREVFNRSGTTQSGQNWAVALDPRTVSERDPRRIETVPRASSPQNAPPVRRVLPALMSVSALSEPEPEVQVAIKASQDHAPVRSRRPRGDRTPPIRATERDEPAPSLPEAVVTYLPSPELTVAATGRAVKTVSRSPRSVVARRAAGQRVLGPGERWKRRLPPACW